MKKQKSNATGGKKKSIEQSVPSNNRWQYILLAVSVLIAFSGALSCKFTNWDDQYYVTNNQAITSWSSEHLREMFLGFTAGNYHPLTMLSFSLDYFLYHENPTGYHFTNLLIHIINTLLVFTLIMKLAGRKDIAFLVALFFGIQPMHAESVVWISERKDLLYTLFLLLSSIAYLKLPPDSGRYSIKKYGIVLLFFLLALLSKGQAVILPMLFLLIDYYKGETRIRSRWLEKIPMFLLSISFGLIAIKAQHSTEAMSVGIHLDALHRILAAGFGIFTYTWKAILPINLSCLYQFPSSLPWDWYYYFGATMALTILLFVFLKRKKNAELFFGMLFFVISLLPVLQLLPVGNAIVAERYTYLAYIGLFFALFSFWKTKEILKQKSVIAAVAIGAIVFMILSWNRCDVWKDSVTLWTDVIDEYPECAIAYCNRGVAYSNAKQFDLAEKDYEMAVQYDSLYTEALNDIGLIYNNKGKFDEALTYFNKAIKSDAGYGEAYNNRGVVLAQGGHSKAALADFSQSVKLLPTYANAWFNKGNALVETGDTVGGLRDMEQSAKFYLSQGNKDGYNHVKERIGSLHKE